jgi:hypothetical protein
MIRTPPDASKVRAVLIGLGWLFVAYFYIMSIESSPTIDGFALLSQVPKGVVMPALVDAALLGLLLSVMQFIGRFDDEMLFASYGHTLSGGAVPAGLLVPLASILSLYLAMLVYIILAIGQDRVSASVAKAFGATLALTFFFAVPHINADANGSMLTQMLLWLSGPSFTAFCLGWLVADVVRPHW